MVRPHPIPSLAMVALLVFASTCARRAAPYEVVHPAPTPATNPSGSTTRRVPDARRTLAEELARDYWKKDALGTPRDWRQGYLNQIFDVARRRDKQVAAVSDLVARLPHPQRARLLMFEHLGAGGGQQPGYKSGMICAILGTGVPDGVSELADLERAGATRVSPDTWRTLQLDELAGRAFAGATPQTKGRPAFDALDVLLVSYFDGESWRVEPWMGLTQFDFVNARPADLPADLRHVYQMLHAVRHGLRVPVLAGEEWFAVDMVIGTELLAPEPR